MPVNFGNAIVVLKVIHINVINKVRRLCFGGALLFALILEKLTFLRKSDCLENIGYLKFCAC